MKNELIWKKRETGWIPYTREFAPDSPSRPYPTIWNDLDTTANQGASKDIVWRRCFRYSKARRHAEAHFDMSTNPGDLVLDSFAGSGTTGAVAHKMGLRWIMVELGEHCHTHIIPRLQKVIAGEDKGGVTESTGWQGGGGFRYYTLAPSLIVNDRWGNSVINPNTTLRNWPKRSPNWKASATRPPKCSGGSTATPASATLSTSPRRTCPPSSCRRCPMKWVPTAACWSAALLSTA